MKLADGDLNPRLHYQLIPKGHQILIPHHLQGHIKLPHRLINQSSLSHGI